MQAEITAEFVKNLEAGIAAEVAKKVPAKRKAYEVWDIDLRGFVLRVEPTGRLTYYAEYARHKRMRIGPANVVSAATARKRARDYMADHVKGVDPAEERRKARSHTLESFVDERYREWAEANMKSARETLRKLASFYPVVKGKKLAEITAWLIEKHRVSRLKDITAVTANRELASLKAALGKAVEWGLLKENPIQKVKQTKEDSSARVRYLTDQESKRLRDALDGRERRRRKQRDDFNVWRRERGYKPFPDYAHFTDHLRPMVLLALNSGMRRGELFNLKWPDIDLATRMVTVIGRTAKTGQTRHIPMNDEAYGVMCRWREQSTGDGYVFPSHDGGRMDNISTSWERLIKDAKIRNFRFHDCRHDFASKLVMAGVDLNTVRELLGHSDIKMTLRYAHLAPEHKAAAVAKLMEGR